VRRAEKKKARKEHGEEDQNLKKPSSKRKQTDQEPEVSRKKKSVSKKRKVADPKDTQDHGFISAANTQNLLERRQHVSCKPEVPVVEIEEGEEENRTNQPASSLQPKSKPQPSSIHLHVVQSAVPAEPVQINSESQPRPINVVKSTDSVSNSQSQPADAFQQRDVPNLMHQLLADKQSNGSESTPFPPQQSSNLSIATRSPSSSNYKSASPVNPASRFQFSSTPLGSSHSALRRRPLPSHLSMSSPQQFMNSSDVLSSPVIPQQECSISQSLSHCSMMFQIWKALLLIHLVTATCISCKQYEAISPEMTAGIGHHFLQMSTPLAQVVNLCCSHSVIDLAVWKLKLRN